MKRNFDRRSPKAEVYCRSLVYKRARNNPFSSTRCSYCFGKVTDEECHDIGREIGESGSAVEVDSLIIGVAAEGVGDS